MSILLNNDGIEFYKNKSGASDGEIYRFSFEQKIDDKQSDIEKPDSEEKVEVEEKTEEKKQDHNEENNDFAYETYTNTRFGFSVEHPIAFHETGVPQNNDGREFRNEEASIIASGSHNDVQEENSTIETHYNLGLESIESPIVYQQVSDNWYVISYFEGGNTMYVKGVLRKNILSTLEITYPTNKQSYYEAMVNRVTKSFVGGQEESSW